MHTDREFENCPAAIQAHELLLSLGFTDWSVEDRLGDIGSSRSYRKRPIEGSLIHVELRLQDDGADPYPVADLRYAPFSVKYGHPSIEIFALYPHQLPDIKQYIDYAVTIGETMQATPYPGREENAD